nr:MAG TPA: hypothetical protein [Caudoviricetes sp.]
MGAFLLKNTKKKTYFMICNKTFSCRALRTVRKCV